MALLKELGFAPGVVKDDSELAAALRRNIRRWTDSDRIRFINGLPQKIGGWKHHVSTTFSGICRGLLAWQDGSSVARIAIGTHTKLYAVEATTFHNITPIRATSGLTNPFSVSSGSATVTVTDSVHGAAAGDSVQISGASAVGGITPDGTYAIATVVNGDVYTITHSSNATSTASGGGSVTAKYEISIGRQNALAGDGYGVGGYGLEGYGDARAATYILLPPRTWSLDLWGQYLVACPRGGNIYEWQNDPATPAAIVSNAPTGNAGIFVTEEKHLVVLDAGGTKMKIQWSDQDDNTTWTASDQTTAGSRNVTGGSELLFGMRARGTNLIFSDGSIWAMTFIGGLDVFAFEQVAAGASGVIGPRAGTEVNGIAFWMSYNDFMMYDGAVKPIPHSKDVRRFVLDNLTVLQRAKVYCGSNTQFSEVWWLYPTGTEIDRYVKVNLEDFSWDVGSIVRTALIDRGIFANPIMAGTDGILYAHESGNDDISGTATATASMAEFIVSSPVTEQAHRVFDIVSVYPDFQDLAGTLTVTILTRYYPQGAQTTTIAGTVGTSTTQLDKRVSGREHEMRFGDSTIGGTWRLGTIMVATEPGGER